MSDRTPLTVKKLRAILADMPPDALVGFWSSPHWCYFPVCHVRNTGMQSRGAAENDRVLYPASSGQGKGKILPVVLLSVGRPEPGQEDYIP